MIRKFFTTVALLFLLLSPLKSETIWSDDFEENSGWLLSGEFQMAAPQGLGGEYGNPDPSVAYGGIKVLGVDLTGIGSFLGDYENNLGNREYNAISPSIDCSSFLDVQLSFMRWLNVEQPAYDHAYIDVSNDDGTTWLEIWTNTSVITNNYWNQAIYDLSAIADLHSNVRIRFSIGSTDGSWQYSGWNIDDLLISGTEAVFGAIEGNIVDATNNDPISFAQVMSPFGNTISDEDGYFLLTDIPTGNQSISVTALGYLAYTQDDIMVVETDTTYVLCELLPDPDLPPEPQNLEASVYNGNNVHLTWEEPNYIRDILLAYNVYRNGIIIQSVLEEEYFDLNMINGQYIYFVTAVYDTGESAASDPVSVLIYVTDIGNEEIPAAMLLSSYPNPFHQVTRIAFSMRETAHVTLEVYNLKGQKVKTLKTFPSGSCRMGTREVVWDGKDSNDKRVSSGIYFYRLKVNNKTAAVKKCLLLR
jgi:hypothetical protein